MKEKVISATDSKMLLLKQVISDLRYQEYLPKDFLGDSKRFDVLKTFYGKEIITGGLIRDVIIDVSFESVLQLRDKKEIKTGKILLSKIEGIDVNNIVKEVDGVLSALPINYNFIFRLPKCQQEIPSTKISKDIEIVSMDDGLSEEGAGLSGLRKAALNLRKSIFKKGDLILRVSCSGYVGKYGIVTLYSVDPFYIWKVVLGVYAGLNLLQKSKDVKYTPFARNFTFDIYRGKKDYVRSFSESAEDNEFVSSQEFINSAFEPDPLGVLVGRKEALFSYANKVLTNLFSKSLFTKLPVKSVIDKQQRTLRNGAYWYYESLKTQAEHVRIIYMTTAFDSLLGGNQEDNKEHKAKLVSVYIGTNAIEEENIRLNIIRLYKERNDIVHGSKEVSSLDKYADWEVNENKAHHFFHLRHLGRFIKERVDFFQKSIFQLSAKK